MLQNPERLASAMAKEMEYDSYDICNFAAIMLEECNEHNLALALRFLAVLRPDHAIQALKLEIKHLQAGELTPELREERIILQQYLKANSP